MPTTARRHAATVTRSRHLPSRHARRRNEIRWNGPAIKAIVRADIHDATTIRAIMADDMRANVAAAGAVTDKDLMLIGWTASQVSQHSPHAAVIAHRAAGQDA